MQISYSRVEKFRQCPFAYKLRYKDELKTIFNCDPKNALVQGSAVHKGLEIGANEALEYYTQAYPVLTDAIETEKITIAEQVRKAREICPAGEHEVKIENEQLVGYLDLVTQNEDGSFDIYDFKFSNNSKNYLQSAQLHLYKIMFELIMGEPVRDLHYLMIPKVAIKPKKDESAEQFRLRVKSELRSSKCDPYIIDVPNDPCKAHEWFMAAFEMLNCKKFEKKESYLCHWCEFEKYCKEGKDYMILPKNERRKKEVITAPNIWLYGDSYVGKTTFVDQMEGVLFLNTDGNTENATSPYIPVANEVKTEGRITKKKFAWEVLKEAVDELEKKDNDYKIVATDLFEDLYEHCRVYMYDHLGIEHEQDAGFGKGWDMVKTEFLSTIKRLNHLGYQVIFISKEFAGTVNSRSGSSITTYRPNIQDKIAQVITGVVGLTVRAFIDGDGQRKLQLQKKENVFGGGRFDFKNPTCPLEVDAFIEELRLAQDSTVEKKTGKTPRKSKAKPEAKEETAPEEVKEEKSPFEKLEYEPSEEEPKRTRKPRGEQVEETEAEPVEEAPKRTRKPRAKVEEPTEDAPEEPTKEAPTRTRTRRKRGE